MVLSPFPSQLHDLLRDQSLRLLTGEIDATAATDALYETIESDPHHWLTLADEIIPMPKMWARAVGRKGGRAASCDCWLTPAMWDVGGYFLTSVSLAVAVRKLLRLPDTGRPPRRQDDRRILRLVGVTASAPSRSLEEDGSTRTVILAR